MSYISERNPQTNTHHPLAEVYALGGVLTNELAFPLYLPILSGGSIDSLGNHSHYLPHPKRCLSTAEELYKRAEDSIIPAIQDQAQPSVIVGHSLGGAIATKLGLEHPEAFSDVITLAGAEAGIPSRDEASLTLRALLRIIGNVPGNTDVLADSAYMHEQKERIQSEWSPGVTLHLIKPTFDDLMRFPHGLDLQLPEGQSPKRMIVAPLVYSHFNFKNVIDISSAKSFMKQMRKVSGMNDLEAIYSVFPATHYDIPLNPSVVSYVRRIRKNAAQANPNQAPLYLSQATNNLAEAA